MREFTIADGGSLHPAKTGNGNKYLNWVSLCKIVVDRVRGRLRHSLTNLPNLQNNWQNIGLLAP